MTITSGVVSIEDGTKAAEEYAPARKVRVELHFDIPEGTDEGQRILDAVSRVADAKVNELLGRRVAGKPVDTVKIAEGAKALTDKDKLAAAAGVLEPAKTEPATTGARRGPKTKAEKEAIAAAEAAKAAAVKKDPTQIDLEDLTSAPATTKPAADLDDLESAPAAEVTDQALSDAVQKRNAEIANPPKIRALIGSFNPDPSRAFTLKEIPQGQRADFLAKLAALTKD